MTAAPTVVVEGLTKVYEPLPFWMRMLTRSSTREPITALDAVDLTVEPGSICAVVGPNGAGKSTLFRILMGLTPPSAGRARILGVECKPGIVRRGLSIGFMPADDRSLLLRLSCRDNLIFQGQMWGYSGVQLTRRVDEVLDLVGLGPASGRAAFALSSGMRARLQLGRALVHEPEVLVLDEPTSAVDPVAAYDLLCLIQDLARDRSLAVLLSSHRLEEIDALDETVLLLDRGRAVFSGALGDLRSQAPRTQVSVEFDGASAAARAAAATIGSLDRVTVDDRCVDVETAGTVGDVLASLGSELRHVVQVTEHSRSTREVLQRLYSGNDAAESDQ